MNILHHKSWHVRTKKNIEKVRKDEQRALEEQKEKARKADLAEQERRIEQLRNKFNVDKLDKYSDQQTVNEKQSDKDLDKKHINFFQEDYDNFKNKAHELEKKIEQEQWEKKVGILTYLGGNQRADLPWYERLPTQESTISNAEVSTLLNNDPLVKIKEELNKRKKEEETLNKKRDFQMNKFNKDDRFKRNDRFNKNQRFSRTNLDKRLNETNQTATNSQSNDKPELTEKEIKLKLLRDKRLKREAKELKRSKNLFNDNSLFNHCLNDRERAYTNQFNPHLAKR